MHTYHNKKHAFDMELPDDWAITRGLARLPVLLSNILNRADILEEFSGGIDEHLNIVIEPMKPEIPPDINKLIFTLHAIKNNYTDLQFNEIIIKERHHTCATYTMGSKIWHKKYLVVLNGIGYAFTASCSIKNRNPSTETVWDVIVQSLRIYKPIDESLDAVNNAASTRRMLYRLRETLEEQVEIQTRIMIARSSATKEKKPK